MKTRHVLFIGLILLIIGALTGSSETIFFGMGVQTGILLHEAFSWKIFSKKSQG